MIDLFDSFIVSWIFVKIGLFNGSLLDGYRPLSKPTITHCQWTPKNKFQWTLQWRYNERDGVSNHRCSDCLFNVCSNADQRKHQSSASLAFVKGIYRWSVDSAHTGSVTREMFPFDGVIIIKLGRNTLMSFDMPEYQHFFFFHKMLLKISRAKSQWITVLKTHQQPMW